VGRIRGQRSNLSGRIGKMKKKNTRPNYPMIDFSGASDETIKAVCKALAEEEDRLRRKARTVTHT
jgi:hypothetical protein